MQTIALDASGSPAPAHRTTYRAPWSALLWFTSSLVTLICLSISGYQFYRIETGSSRWAAAIAVAIIAMLASSILFTVRGFTLDRKTLVIDRVLWSTRIPLADLLSATYERKAMGGSVRTLGNGGAFSFTGYYWSARLGRYRAFVTNFQNTVILRFPQRTVVVSPERPQDFAREILARARA